MRPRWAHRAGLPNASLASRDRIVRHHSLAHPIPVGKWRRIYFILIVLLRATSARERTHLAFSATLLQDLLQARAFFCARQARAKEHEDALSRGSDCLYACGFRIYFTPLPGFFSPFPHGTGSLSVDYEYLALEDGPPIFRQDFSCPALLLATLVARSRFRIRGYHPLWPAFPDRFANSNANGCRLLRFRSPLLSESRLISVPPATEMFQFTGFALPTL